MKKFKIKKFKIKTIKTDWLYEIRGATVSNAITYLKTLDQNCTMELWSDEYNEFDSALCLAIPLTDEELYEQEINDLKSKIKYTEIEIQSAEYELCKLCYNKESAIKTFKQATLTYHETRLIEFKEKLDELLTTKNKSVIE